MIEIRIGCYASSSMLSILWSVRASSISWLIEFPLAFTPMAIAVFTFISSPNLKEPSFLSLTVMSGTFLEAANAVRCFVKDRGLQSDANNIA